MRGCHKKLGLWGVILFGALGAKLAGQSLSIYQIQSNTVDGDRSVYDTQVVDCRGGVCVGKYGGFRPRLILQDPAYPDAWGGIQVKDWTNGDLFDNVELGDWVSLDNVLVEEYRNTTFLQYQTPYNPSFEILSHGNPLPPIIAVPVVDIPAPLARGGGEWRVEDHEAELYESMRLIIRDVTVTQMHLGKAVDNYNLQNAEEHDCWAADYMNAEKEPSGYHPFVGSDQHFCAVAGVFEQYTKLTDGWDYYQLLTLNTEDLAICGDGDHDGDADLEDWPHLYGCLTGPACESAGETCEPPVWMDSIFGRSLHECVMMDMDYDGDVDLRDVARFQMVIEASGP